VCLLATAILPSDTMTGPARAAISAAAMGLAFMGAIVLPVYLVPALTVVLALGLAAESGPALWSAVRWPAGRGTPAHAPAQPAPAAAAAAAARGRRG
jgi:hypothetical protein